MEILPVKKITIDDKGFKAIPEPIMPPPFCGGIVAGVKSGKSVTMINLIYRAYKPVFDKLFYISPNVFNDDIFETNVAIDDDIVKVDKGLEDVDLIAEGIVEMQKKISKKDRKHILIVFDDCLGFIKPRRYITNFCTRYRQLKISMVFIMQALKALPSVIRANLSWMIYFRSYNKKELDKFYEEFAHIPGIRKLYEEATKEKYSFLYINMRDLTLYKRFTLPPLYDRDGDDPKPLEESLTTK